MIRVLIRIILALLIIFLSYKVYESIMDPIRFIRQKNIREKKAITRMKDIREAQKAYKDVHFKYTDSFDSLIGFLKSDSFSVIKAVGMIPESLSDSLGITRAREIALEQGIIRRSVTRISVFDSLFGKSYPADSIKFVPFAGNEQFRMNEGDYTTPSSLKVKVLEVSVRYDVLLNGLDQQLIINYTDERQKISGFPGLRFGSMTEGTLDGNWE